MRPLAPARSARHRSCRLGGLQPGRLRIRLGGAGRPQGSPFGTDAAPSGGRPGGGRSLLAAGQPGGQGGGGTAAPRGAAQGVGADAEQQQFPEWPHPGGILHRLRPARDQRPGRWPVWVLPRPWRPVGSTCGRTTPPTSSVGPPSARCWAWACGRWSTWSRPEGTGHAVTAGSPVRPGNGIAGIPC